MRRYASSFFSAVEFKSFWFDSIYPLGRRALINQARLRNLDTKATMSYYPSIPASPSYLSGGFSAAPSTVSYVNPTYAAAPTYATQTYAAAQPVQTVYHAAAPVYQPVQQVQQV